MRERVLRVYIVEVVSRSFSGRISQEGYFTLEDAQRFIEKRAETPEKISNFRYQGRNGDAYYIHDILIRGEPITNWLSTTTL